MQLSEHARNRLRQRQIGEREVNLALQYGEWNARGDRLTLNKRVLRSLIAERRQALRRTERREHSWDRMLSHEERN